MTDIAFIGLGVMGFPMAGHLHRAGHQVTVYNRTPSRAEAWAKEYGGGYSTTPAQAAKTAQVVFICVGNDDDVRSVVYGPEGILSGLTRKDGLLIDHTTASDALARELHAVCKEQGLGFLDAPVSGGQAGAENGALTVMVGGDEADFANGAEIMACYSRACRRMGDAGAGQLTKMVNQVCIAGILEGLAEGIHLAEKAGLDVESVVDVISKGAAQSWQMDNRHKTMAAGEFEFGFAVDWMRKDLGIALDTARQLNARLPLAALVDQFYGEVQAMDGGRWDTSSLLQRFR